MLDPTLSMPPDHPIRKKLSATFLSPDRLTKEFFTLVRPGWDLLFPSLNPPEIAMIPRHVKILLCLVLLSAPCRAAVSILIGPGTTPETTTFTVTQTSASPLLDVSGISGYVLAMSIPTSMFNIPGLDPGTSSDIYGDLIAPVATITEFFSGQSYLLKKIFISSDPLEASYLGFDTVFVVPDGATSLRFDVTTAGPVETNISLEALHPGVHVIEDPLFGTVTVTVVPEPGSLALLALPALTLLARRRRTPA